MLMGYKLGIIVISVNTLSLAIVYLCFYHSYYSLVYDTVDKLLKMSSSRKCMTINFLDLQTIYISPK